MNPLFNLAWDYEVETAVWGLRRTEIEDTNYWLATVDIVDAGYDPQTKKAITKTGLKNWVLRCKTRPPEEKDYDTPTTTIKPRVRSTADRVLPDTSSRNDR